MPLTYSSNRVTFAGVGGLSFLGIPFPLFHQDDLIVYETFNQIEKKLVLGQDYTVQLTGPRQINFINNYQSPNGANMTLVRRVPLIQNYNWLNNDKFDAEEITKAFDRVYMALQQLSDDLYRRALLFPDSASVQSIAFPVPDPGRFLAWNEDGTELINVDAPSTGQIGGLPRPEFEIDPNDPDPYDGYAPFYLGDGSLFGVGDEDDLLEVKQ